MKARFGWVSVAGLMCLAVLSLSCSKKSTSSAGGGGNPPPSGNIGMAGSAFNPSPRTVTVGSTVTWVNNDGINHTVTSSTMGLFDSGILTPSQTFSQIFNSAGTFGYYCQLHGTPNSGMRGTIIVQ